MTRAPLGIVAVISARVPSCYKVNPKVVRLFENFREVEAAYFRKTRIFPIMHMVGIRKSLLEANPWLAVSVYDGSPLLPDHTYAVWVTKGITDEAGQTALMSLLRETLPQIQSARAAGSSRGPGGPSGAGSWRSATRVAPSQPEIPAAVTPRIAL